MRGVLPLARGQTQVPSLSIYAAFCCGLLGKGSSRAEGVMQQLQLQRRKHYTLLKSLAPKKYCNQSHQEATGKAATTYES